MVATPASADDTQRPLEFALYRILGNSLPPRHGPGDTLALLRFTLEHEPALDGCRKHWVLNRIADPQLEAACIALIEAAQQPYIRLPFELHRYAHRFNDISELPAGYERLNPVHSDAAFSASTFALEWKLRHKSLYAIGLNEVRNAALDAGRAIARWTLPWDGACFLTAEAWHHVREGARQADAAALHLVVPLARVRDAAALLKPGFRAEGLTEPQLGFRFDSRERFDEGLRYGNLNKVALLQRLGVPGPWQTWRGAGWDAVSAEALQRPSPERQRFVSVGWVARLPSGGDERIDAHEWLRWRARFLGVEGLCRELDARVVAANAGPGRLLCHDESALAAAGHGVWADALRASARATAHEAPPSVRDKTGCAPSGDPADYFSVAPYFHADLGADAGGARLQMRDGVRNEAATVGTLASQATDRPALDRFVRGVCTAALAGRLSGEAEPFAQAARWLRAWFIDPATRMNPHRHHAQVVPGGAAGQAWGVVEFRGLVPVLDAITLAHRAGALGDPELAAIHAWWAEFSADLARSRAGQEPNNIAVWHDLLAAAVAAFLGDHAGAARVLSDVPLHLATQLGPFGVPVHELRRTRPLHYGLFLAHALAATAWLGRRLGIDLWQCAASQHRSIAMLVRFLALNGRLLGDHADDPAGFARRIAQLRALVPADAVHADALSDLALTVPAAQPGVDDLARDLTEGLLPFFAAFGVPASGGAGLSRSAASG